MRYFGGKARIAGKIADYINNLYETQCNISEEKQEFQNKSQNTLTSTHTTYVEPFCGACNVATKVNIPNKILNDKHPYLIAMWKALQNGWIPPTEVTEEDYKLIKEFKDDFPYLTGFVGFGCSFAGKYFGGYARDGKGGNYAIRAKNSVLKKIDKIKTSEFLNKDFSELNFENSLIYCDPPYRNTTQYNKQLLGEFNYPVFLEWVKEQSKNNIVLVSEYKYNLPESAKIVFELDSKTSIRDKSDKVINTTEILFTYNDI